jgi:mannose-6-phosphate isomerase-like protein (cupin superfamily)
MPEQPAFGNRDQVEGTERPDGVVIRRLAQGAGLDLTEYTVPRGFATGASGSDRRDKIGYVVSGRVEITTPDGSVTVEAGGADSIPRGVPHQFTVLEDAVMVQVRRSPDEPSPGRT